MDQFIQPLSLSLHDPSPGSGKFDTPSQSRAKGSHPEQGRSLTDFKTARAARSAVSGEIGTGLQDNVYRPQLLELTRGNKSSVEQVVSSPLLAVVLLMSKKKIPCQIRRRRVVKLLHVVGYIDEH